LLYGTNPDLLLADLLLVAAPLFQAKIFSFAARFEFGFPQSFQFFSQTALLSRAFFKAKSSQSNLGFAYDLHNLETFTLF